MRTHRFHPLWLLLHLISWLHWFNLQRSFGLNQAIRRHYLVRHGNSEDYRQRFSVIAMEGPQFRRNPFGSTNEFTNIYHLYVTPALSIPTLILALTFFRSGKGIIGVERVLQP